MLAPAGPAAAISSEVAWVLFIGAALILVIVLALTCYALTGRRRVRAGAWLIGGGFVFPVAVLTPLLVYGVLRGTALLERAPESALVIQVTAHSWWWEVVYPGDDGREAVITANEIRIPSGRPIRLAVSSTDVIHSLWVPQLAGKIDLVPGRINHLTFAGDRPGSFRGQCAEFCGEAHARMALHVVVVTPDEFDGWLAAQQASATDPVDARARRGRELFERHGCSQCHAVRGVTVGSGRAPDLTHVASRPWLGAGVLRNQPGAMLAWITSVQQLKPGARMPSYGHLDGDALDALAHYLEQLN